MATAVPVTLLFFASVRDSLQGKKEQQLTLPTAVWPNPSSLLEHICDHQLPQLSQLKNSLVIAINQEYCLTGEVTVSPGDTLALIPSITGG